MPGNHTYPTLTYIQQVNLKAATGLMFDERGHALSTCRTRWYTIERKEDGYRVYCEQTLIGKGELDWVAECICHHVAKRVLVAGLGRPGRQLRPALRRRQASS